MDLKRNLDKVMNHVDPNTDIKSLREGLSQIDDNINRNINNNMDYQLMLKVTSFLNKSVKEAVQMMAKLKDDVFYERTRATMEEFTKKIEKLKAGATFRFYE